MRGLLCLLLTGCGTSAVIDAGLDSGSCSPAAMGLVRCSDLTSFPHCLPTEPQTREAMCDLAVTNPHVSRWTCLDGRQWRIDDFPQKTCSFADGGLVGATIAFERNPSVGGSWQLHDCVQELDTCAESDAGSCRPRATGNRRCEEERSAFSFCAATEADQRMRLCSDAGLQAYGRHSAACDGGVQLREVISGTGPTRTCFYVDGGFAGASELNDTNTGPVTGFWSLPDCQPTPLCP